MFAQKPGYVMRKRVEVPQFDFDQLPKIPNSKSYFEKMREIKVIGPNTFTLEKPKNNQMELTNGENDFLLKKKVNTVTPLNYKLPDIKERKVKSESSTRTRARIKFLNRESILKYSHVENEDEALECLACDKNLEDVNEEELSLFKVLYFMDLSNNRLEFEKLGNLISLKELNLNCNSLTKIKVPTKNNPSAFCNLQILYLAYNNFIDPYLFHELCQIKKLTKLDLSGNNLQGLPNDLSEMKNLNILILEDNVLDDSIFYSLNSMPSLKEVFLNGNRIERIPKIDQHIGLNKLEFLQLDDNVITYYEDLYQLIEFRSLKRVSLYNNPITKRNKDLSKVQADCTSADIIVMVDSTVPPSSKLPVTKFYTLNEMRSVRKLERETRRQLEQKRLTEERPHIQIDTTEDSSSFFLTAIPTLDFGQIHSEQQKEERIITPNSSSRMAPTKLFSPRSNSEIAKITQSYEKLKDLSARPKVSYEFKETKKSDITMNKYEYNKDWFDLDMALSTIDEALEEEIKRKITANQEKKNLHLLNDKVDLYKTNLNDKKKTYKALKFALENPITIDMSVNKKEKSISSPKQEQDLSLLKEWYK
ncbi:hypothetical protein ABK040_009256 [Willaertia magna]